MFHSRRFRIPRDLVDGLEQLRVRHGYGSCDEMLLHVLEKLAEAGREPDDVEQTINERLRGLGYLD